MSCCMFSSTSTEWADHLRGSEIQRLCLSGVCVHVSRSARLTVCVCVCACFITNCSTAKTQSININVDSFGSLETSLVLAAGSLGQAHCAQHQANNSTERQ